MLTAEEVKGFATEVHDPDAALISRYAWGQDYHDVLGRRAEALIERMRAATDDDFEARWYVDTGPVQERVYAQYAGLGWIGKHTCLIHPEQGSWIFLAEIITSLALDPDAPQLDQCGSCTLCLEACPTDALREPWVLDATRCLSYLTIELRGAIPEHWRGDIGTHVYGCDICQDVCPYNHPAPQSGDPAWQPAAALDRPTLVDLWRRPDSDTRTLLGRSAMSRAKLTGFRRNVAVALGNSGTPAARAALDEPAGAAHASPVIHWWPGTSIGRAPATSRERIGAPWLTPVPRRSTSRRSRRRCSSRCRSSPIRISTRP